MKRCLLAISLWWGWENTTSAYRAFLTVQPESPTSLTPVTVRVELTNNSLDPCDFEVRLAMAYAGLTFFERERKDNTFTFRGGLWPHLIPPMVPCDVPCIEILQPPHEVYASLELGHLEPGEYDVLVFLPPICDLPTPCERVPVVRCEGKLPLATRFRVQGPAAVRRRTRLTVAWAELKTQR